MPKKILEAKHIPNVGYRYKVHVDTNKKNPYGDPDPAYVYEWTWGPDPPPGVNPAKYRENIEAQMQALANAVVVQEDDTGTKLPAEGTEF